MAGNLNPEAQIRAAVAMQTTLERKLKGKLRGVSQISISFNGGEQITVFQRSKNGS